MLFLNLYSLRSFILFSKNNVQQRALELFRKLFAKVNRSHTVAHFIQRRRVNTNRKTIWNTLFFKIQTMEMRKKINSKKKNFFKQKKAHTNKSSSNFLYHVNCATNSGFTGHTRFDCPPPAVVILARRKHQLRSKK